MFLGINIFWAQMSLSRAQNIFMPANINSIVILYKICSNEVHTSSSRCHKVSYAIHLHISLRMSINYHYLIGVVVRVVLVNEKQS